MTLPKRLDTRMQTLKALALYVAALMASMILGSFAHAQSVDPKTVEPPLPQSSTPMTFARACEVGTSTLTLAAVGDILPQSDLSVQSYNSSLGFASLWPKLTSYISGADIAYGNLEGPTAEGVAIDGRVTSDPGPTLDRYVYTATNLQFNYHPRIIDDLKRSGFDIVSIANNHALDRSSIGVDRTIEALLARNMPYSGARRTTDRSASISTLIDRAGFRIAFIACTDVWNGSDPKQLITACASDQVVREIKSLNQDSSVDAVIVTPHWGEEYHHVANSRQRSLARKFLDAGASAVIGSHPHMLQEMESYRTRDGRDTVVAYSLGNFVSGQGSRPGLKISVLMYVGLTKRVGEKAWVNGVSYLPLWMDRGPNSINLAENSRQAPKSLVTNQISRLMDPSRALRTGSAIRTNIGCP